MTIANNFVLCSWNLLWEVLLIPHIRKHKYKLCKVTYTLINLILVITVCIVVNHHFVHFFKTFMWQNPNISNFVNHFNKLEKKKNNKGVLVHQQRMDSKKCKVVSHIRHLTELIWKQITLYMIKKISRTFLKFHYHLIIDNALYANAIIIVTNAVWSHALN